MSYARPEQCSLRKGSGVTRNTKCAQKRILLKTQGMEGKNMRRAKQVGTYISELVSNR